MTPSERKLLALLALNTFDPTPSLEDEIRQLYHQIQEERATTPNAEPST